MDVFQGIDTPGKNRAHLVPGNHNQGHSELLRYTYYTLGWPIKMIYGGFPQCGAPQWC